MIMPCVYSLGVATECCVLYDYALHLQPRSCYRMLCTLWLCPVLLQNAVYSMIMPCVATGCCVLYDYPLRCYRMLHTLWLYLCCYRMLCTLWLCPALLQNAVYSMIMPCVATGCCVLYDYTLRCYRMLHTLWLYLCCYRMLCTLWLSPALLHNAVYSMIMPCVATGCCVLYDYTLHCYRMLHTLWLYLCCYRMLCTLWLWPALLQNAVYSMIMPCVATECCILYDYALRCYRMLCTLWLYPALLQNAAYSMPCVATECCILCDPALHCYRMLYTLWWCPALL